MKSCTYFVFLSLLGLRMLSAANPIQLSLPCQTQAQSKAQTENRSDQTISARFDREHDSTIVILHPVIIYEGEGICRDGIRMIAEFRYRGEIPQRPRGVALGLFTSPRSGIAGKDLVIVADGERLELGKMTLNQDDFSQWPGCRNLYETTGLIEPRDTFLKFKHAERIEIQTNGMVMTLNEAHAGALREFARRVP
jgi:hypothetical protein